MKPILSALAGIAMLATPALADEVFVCTDTNTTLHFVLYEDSTGPRGGHVYLNNLQTAVLDTWRVNQITTRGRIVGNTANTELVFNSDRRVVYVELADSSEVVCNANVLN